MVIGRKIDQRVHIEVLLENTVINRTIKHCVRAWKPQWKGCRYGMADEEGTHNWPDIQFSSLTQKASWAWFRLGCQWYREALRGPFCWRQRRKGVTYILVSHHTKNPSYLPKEHAFHIVANLMAIHWACTFGMGQVWKSVEAWHARRIIGVHWRGSHANLCEIMACKYVAFMALKS